MNKKSATMCFVCALLVVCALTGNVHAGDSKHFSVHKLSVADRLAQYWVEDLNVDGRKDIVVVHFKGLEPDETRWVSVFWQGGDGSFSSGPDQSWELDPAAVLIDIGDVAGDMNKEICCVTATSVRYYSLQGDSYAAVAQPLLEAKGLTVFPSERDVPMVNLIRDWNGDGKDEVAVLTFDGLDIYTRDGNGDYSRGNMVSVELNTEMSRTQSRTMHGKTSGITASFSFPDIVLADYDGDSRRDIIATTEDRVVVHRLGADGRFTAAATADVSFDVRTQQEKIEDLAELETVVTDLDDDGYADAVVTKQVSKGLTNFRGVVNIFRGGPGGFKAKPDQVLISEGTASARAFFLDVNGDGRKDLVLPSIKFNIAAIVRILVTRSLKVYFNIFLLNEDNRLSERPDFTKEVKFKIDLSGESDEQALDLEGDYDGDGQTDFVFATGENELSIFLGQRTDRKRLFSKRAVAKVKADAFGDLYSPDLNGDGLSDMILYYPENKSRRGMIQVLMNRGTLGK